MQRTWSESGGRIEHCRDGEDRWVTLPAWAIAALRAHCEAMELEARERHERDVDQLDAPLWGVDSAGDGGGTLESDDAERPAASHCVPPAAGRALSADQRGGELMVEGKGFEPSTSALRTPRSPN